MSVEPRPVSHKDDTCPRCGKARRRHAGGWLWTCDVPDDVLRALREYRECFGRPWRRRLAGAWKEDRALSYLLARARDLIGPVGLRRVDLDCGLPRDQRSIRPDRSQPTEPRP